jgi:tRNA pseudouridine55 synthase
VIREAPLPTAGIDEVRSVLAGFIGKRQQVPPKYSAIKVKGKPLYHYARKGQEVVVKPREITLHDMELVHYDTKSLRVVITCSRGTYARVLADEIAVELGSTGHLSALCRPRSGPFFLEDAIDIDELAKLVSAEPDREWREVLMSSGPREQRVKWLPRDTVTAGLAPYVRRPIDVLSHLPLADVGDLQVKRVRDGAPPPVPPPGTQVGSPYLLVSGDEIVGLAESTVRGPRLLKVLN